MASSRPRSFSLAASVWAGLVFALVLVVSAWGESSSGDNAAGANKALGNQATGNAAGGDGPPVLVELFTSEGCSSCPPADDLLEKMDGQPFPGLRLIVLSEHVTYWDHDGWKDPNSSSALTDRQSSYEQALGQKTPYTPQFIVDGTSVFRMGDRQQVHDIFEKAKTEAKISLRIDDVNLDAGKPTVLRARIETEGNSDRHGDVYVAVALDRVESQVLRGENSGRHLVHVAVVQQITKIGKLEKGRAFDQEVKLKLKGGEDPKNLRIVAFVQEPGPGKVLGVALHKLGS